MARVCPTRGCFDEATLPASAVSVDESEVDERVLVTATLPRTGAVELNAQRVLTDNPARSYCVSTLGTHAMAMHHELVSSEDHSLATARVTGTWAGAPVVGMTEPYECGSGNVVFYGPSAAPWHRVSF